MQHGQIRGEETQLLFEPLGALAVGGQQQGKALCSAGSLGDGQAQGGTGQVAPVLFTCRGREKRETQNRSEEHTSELQSLMRISYAVFCLKKKRQDTPTTEYQF